MARSYPWNRWLTRKFLAKFLTARPRKPTRFRPAVEPLTDRVVPAVTFSFDAATLTLDINGDDTSETITVSNDASGEIFVNGTIDSGHTLANNDTEKVRVFGKGGDDQISLASLNTAPLAGGTVIDGGLGNDNITGSAGNDVLTGGAGSDFINGGAGTNDRLVEQADADYVLTGTPTTANLQLTSGFLIENDTLLQVEQVELTGGPSNNQLNASGFSGRTVLDGGAGTDTLRGGSGNDTLVAGFGSDSLVGNAGTDTVRTTGSNITLSSTSIVVGVTGAGSFSNTLSGIERGDLTGTAGTDSMTAINFTTGAVSMAGLDGNDILTGSPGSDTIDGGAGDDRLTGLAGTDFLTGGSETDTVIASADSDFILNDAGLTSAALGTDFFTLQDVEQASITGGASANTLDASAFDKGAVTLIGGNGNDELDGGSGNDSLAGGDGSDTLNGGGGNDTLSGGGNDGDPDTLSGGAGSDTVQDFFQGNIVLSNTELSNQFEHNTLSGVNVVDLTGTNGNEVYDVSGWTGTGTLDGGAGADTIVNERDNSMTLTDASLDPGAGFLNLVSISFAHLIGGGGNNTLDASGFSGHVTLEGGGGNDSLSAGSNNDSVLGQGGDDTLTGGAGSDTLDGGFGTDVVVEEANVNFTATNTSLTGLGNDTLAGIDHITLTGGPGNNLIDASAFGGKAVEFGLGGNDTLLGGDSGDEDELSGGDGNDSLVGNDGGDLLLGGNNDDTITGGFGDDTMDGGAGNDLLLEAAAGSFTLTNTTMTSPGPSIFNPTDNDSTTFVGDFFERAQLTDTSSALFGLGAGNKIDATSFSGSVTLFGGDGDDTLIGGSGNDSLDGSTGADSLVGNNGDDTLNGGPGNDILLGGAGNDIVILPETGDSINLGSGQDGIVVNGTSGNDVIIVHRVVAPDGPHAVITLNGTTIDVPYLEGETVTVNGLGGNDLIVMDPGVTTWTAAFFGGAGNDTLIGAGLNDFLDGGDGNDDLLGGAGNDMLLGDDGNDDLDGGAGSDTMVGGAGKDTYQAADGEVDFLFVDSKDKVKHADGFDFVIEV